MMISINTFEISVVWYFTVSSFLFKGKNGNTRKKGETLKTKTNKLMIKKSRATSATSVSFVTVFLSIDLQFLE